MLNTQTIRTRLAFIRYLFRRALEQSRQPYPGQAVSVLTFHDAVELFLHLAFEHAGLTGKTDVKFLEYWGRLADASPPLNLSGKTSMDKLNRARVSLKHYGMPPSPGDVEGFRGSVTSFFEDNCTRVFGVDFERVSMVDLVRSDQVRPHLAATEDAIATGDGVRAMNELALAFAKLVDEHEIIGPPPDVVPDGSIRGTPAGLFWNSGEIEKLRAVVSVVALGLDFRRWVRFRRLVPMAVRVSVGETHYGNLEWSGPAPVLTDCQESFDFVIESALKLEAETQ